jgi:hypothetical protein
MAFIPHGSLAIEISDINIARSIAHASIPQLHFNENEELSIISNEVSPGKIIQF